MDGLLTILGKPVMMVKDLLVTSVAILVMSVPLAVKLVQYPQLFSDYISLFNFCNQFSYLGRSLFRFFSVFAAPYSVSIGPTVELLGYDENKCVTCVASMREAPWKKNPFNCIHAVALINLGEYASGIAMLTAQKESPQNVRGIVVSISAEYFKKANGKIKAVAKIEPFPILKDGESIDSKQCTQLYNAKNELVSSVAVLWRISLRQNPKKK